MKTLLSASCCITFTTITSLISQRIVCLHHHPSTKAHPLYKNTPFAFIFNAPSDPCSEKLEISLDLSQFSAVSSPAASAIDQPLTLFYNNRLGLYPFVNEQTAELHNGGIPQDGNLQRHLEQAAEDISFHISSEKANGLAVIDWEDWRPVWMRNWARKIIYQKLSLDSGEFERAAREFMRETLKLGKTLRPNQRWGFYLFPNCYNHRHILNTNYTGQCPEAERARNDGLHWLWEESTALYPSIYFLEDLKDSWKAALFVRHRVLEAMRVAQRPRRSEPIPVYVYNRPVIVGHTQQFLSQMDLVHAVGESAALGAAGMVFWGASADFSDEEKCSAMGKYLEEILNPYLANVSAATQLCSSQLCADKGRCVRKDPHSSRYLHLNPTNFNMQQNADGKHVAVGSPSHSDLKEIAEHFSCHCYAGMSCGDS